MPGDEKLKKDREESDSDEEEEPEVVPQIDIDVTKLSALSPEVISKQVSTNSIRICSLIHNLQATINLGAFAPNDIRKHLLTRRRRYHRACRPRKIDRCKSHFWRHDRPFQKRARPKHHDQTRVRKCKGASVAGVSAYQP